MGTADPTYGRCLSWWGIHCEKGHYGDVKLDGLTTGLILETPGPLAEGGWTFGIYLDENGTPEAHDGLEKIFRGIAGGPISWFSIMIADYLGTKVVPITFENRENSWHLSIPKIIDGNVKPVMGADGETPVMAMNTTYWAGTNVVVSKSTKSRIRDWGRNWDLSGQSAEYAKVDWVGP
ncbi:MAG: DUF1326 domain-containing protein [Chloroflexi bacterium]|nr:DUF1326 domain-containing protein [Chloroflexota bacterium]